MDKGKFFSERENVLPVKKDKINPKIIRTKEQYDPHLRIKLTLRYKKSSFLILKNQEVKSNSIEKHL